MHSLYPSFSVVGTLFTSTIIRAAEDVILQLLKKLPTTASERKRERERQRDRETAEKERVGRKLFIGVLPLHYNSHLLESKTQPKRDKESQAC